MKKKNSRLKMESGDSGNSFSEMYLQKRFVSRKFFDGTDPISKTYTWKLDALSFLDTLFLAALKSQCLIARRRWTHSGCTSSRTLIPFTAKVNHSH